jgi:asparagine synthase (glutamine-hydrolysing)
MGAHAAIVTTEPLPIGGERARTIGGVRPSASGGAVSVYAESSMTMAAADDDLWTGAPVQRLARSPGGLVCAWDGRLDNRHDLLQRLGPTAGGPASDAAIAAGAFERWGVDGLGSLIGEWSLAIWDPDQRQLHLARDYMGVRPLYYVQNGGTIEWSTRLAEIVNRSNLVDALSDEFVARFMALRFSCEITPYDGIRGVPAGTCLSFDGRGPLRRQRFWTPLPGLIRYRDKRQYEEHLRALWRDAVTCRLRTRDTVWAELSGGFDSSAVVCMAASLAQSGAVPCRAVQPVSYVTLRSSEGDERRFIDEVEACIGRSSDILGVEENAALHDVECDWLTPFATYGVALAGAEHIRAHGGRIVLTGRSGDAVMGCEPDNSIAVWDDLAAGRLPTALANLRNWSRSSRKPFVEIVWGLQQATVAGSIRAWQERAMTTSRNGLELLTPGLRELVEDDGPTLGDLTRGVRPARRNLALQIIADASASQLTIPEAARGLFFSHPYTHRPLVDFVLAIPGEELSAPGEIRSLMRRAFAGLVPDRILRRVSKGYYPPSSARALRDAAAGLPPVERLEVVRRGWISGDRLGLAIRRLIDGGGTTAREVRRVLRLEHWLEARSRRAPAANPRREEVRSDEVLDA